MSIFLITLISLWINPILGYILIKFTNKKYRNYIVVFFAFIASLQVFSIFSGITFTSINVDFVFSAVFYLGICFYVWLLVYSNYKIVKFIGVILAILIFGLNYLSGTIGALGVGFALYRFETTQEIKIGDNYIYKEISLGMALDDFRGKRIQIFKQISFLPLEKKIFEQSYYDTIPKSIGKLNVKYNQETKKIYLEGIGDLKNIKTEYWNDTLNIEQLQKHNKPIN